MMRITGGRQRGWRALIAPILVSALSVVGCSSSVGPTEPSGALTTSEIEYQLFQLTNRERAASGAVSELTLSETLSEVARRYSEQMRDQEFFGHVSPDGATLRRRLEAAGIQYSKAGENIAQVTNANNPAVMAHDLLINSKRHRANILEPSFRQVGIGVVRNSDTFWIAQVFVTP